MLQANVYPVERSPLYKLGTRRDLAVLLGVELVELNKLCSDEQYREWIKKTRGKKDRIIEEPSSELGAVLSRLHSLLARVETPDWLMSGKKKVKPQDNAALHSQNPHVITVDIDSFYQSTQREYVFRIFRNVFKQSADVASLLASLVTYNNHIPTGTATSQAIAYWAYSPTFLRLRKLAAQHDIIMSIWVDDITFSSVHPFPKGWEKSIQKIAKEVSLSLKASKTKVYGSSEYKVVTGTAITPEGFLTVKNQKRKEILDFISGRRIESLNLPESRRLFGQLSAQRQNDPAFFDAMYLRLKKHLAQLLRSKKKFSTGR